MNNRVILVLVDGMRPDAVMSCEHPFLRELMSKSASCLTSRTVMPSVTLPCHTSLFLSVTPERHGILTNEWHAQVRPIESLTELVHRFEGKTAMFYNWEQLRDLAKPGSLDFSFFRRLAHERKTDLGQDMELAEMCVKHYKAYRPDFTFLYLGNTDEAGHRTGWMNEEYMEAVSNASACIQKVYESLEDDTYLIVTADHGGQERSHGYDTPECMTIPIIFHGSAFEEGKKLSGVSIMDIAPTVAALLGAPCAREWEGRAKA